MIELRIKFGFFGLLDGWMAATNEVLQEERKIQMVLKLKLSEGSVELFLFRDKKFLSLLL